MRANVRIAIGQASVPRDAFPPTPPGPEGSNGNGLLRVQWVAGAWLLLLAFKAFNRRDRSGGRRETPPILSKQSEHKTYGSGDHCRGAGGFSRWMDFCHGANAAIV